MTPPQTQRLQRRAVFLDRDGVLIANIFYPDSGLWEAPRSPDRYKLYPWTTQALRLLQDAGYALIVISNQPNEALGKSSAAELAAVHNAMQAELQQQGIELTGSFYCFHHPRATNPALRLCDCRKPSPGMVLEAAATFDINLAHSWMIGDRDIDIECGHRANVRTIRIAPDHTQPATHTNAIAADASVQNLLEAAQHILREDQPSRTR